MQITIRYEAQTRRAVGLEEETIELVAPCRVSDCIQHVATLHPESLRPIVINAAGEIQPSLLIFLGDDQVVRDDTKELADGDTLTIMTPISGG
ncbi:MAG: MoaD/ThiS family protein [Pirellulaceae bacterium]|nr:MoaD/ThiS family protein [Planctomycetaceae bacterium]HIM31151.1 MoaD/ThiS family protein [Planctomycetota bacterium]